MDSALQKLKNIDFLTLPNQPWPEKEFLGLTLDILQYFGYKSPSTQWSVRQRRLALLGRMFFMSVLIVIMMSNLSDVVGHISTGKVVFGIEGMILASMNLTGIACHLHYMYYEKKLHSLFKQFDDMIRLSLHISPSISSSLLDKYFAVTRLFIVLCVIANPPSGITLLQTPILYRLQHGKQTNYSEIPMTFEVYYGTEPRANVQVFWMVSVAQMFQFLLANLYFLPMLTLYISIILYFIAMNEITNHLFNHFFISELDLENSDFNQHRIPLRNVLVLHQKLLKGMEEFSDLISALIFMAFVFDVLHLALLFFEIVMFGFDIYNVKLHLMTAAAFGLMFCIMWSFQSISELTSEPLRILYLRPWHLVHDPRLLTNIKMAMIRSTKRVKYTLGGLSTEAKMITFIDLVKCALSYARLLAETKRRSDIRN